MVISTFVKLGVPQDTILQQCHGIQRAEKGFLPFSTYFPKRLLYICSIRIFGIKVGQKYNLLEVFILFLITYMSLCVHVCECRYLWRPLEGVRFPPGPRVTAAIVSYLIELLRPKLRSSARAVCAGNC